MVLALQYRLHADQASRRKGGPPPCRTPRHCPPQRPVQKHPHRRTRGSAWSCQPTTRAAGSGARSTRSRSPPPGPTGPSRWWSSTTVPPTPRAWPSWPRSTAGPTSGSCTRPTPDGSRRAGWASRPSRPTWSCSSTHASRWLRQSLERLRAAVDRGETVWNYDVVPGSRDLRALFWTGITEVWWRDYFRTRLLSDRLRRRRVRPLPQGHRCLPGSPQPAAAWRPASSSRTSPTRPCLRRHPPAAHGRRRRGHPPLARGVVHPPRQERTGEPGRDSATTGGTTFVDGYLGDRDRAQGLLTGLVVTGVVGVGLVAAAPRTAAAGAVLGCLATGR